MSTRKLIRAIQKLPRRTRKLSARLTKGFFTWLLRSLYVLWRRPTTATAGFVLPTTVLLLLMVALTAGALTYRSFSRSEQAIAQREQQVITNSATPAIDRAKAKVEFLFRQDTRFPGGVPSSDFLLAMLLDNGNDGVPQLATGIGPTGADNPYTLPDETQLDINNDSVLDPAWVFPSDVNGDGTVTADELVVYSILTDDLAPIPGTSPTDPTDPTDPNVMEVKDAPNANKARALVTRTGPLNTTEANSNCPGSTRTPGGGWQLVNRANNSLLEKNFQVNAFVLNRNDVNRTVETLEFQQGREAAQGNRWGAWFRYDLEAFPGADLNWNGAMHTEGSFFVRDDFIAHLVSSHNSCIYDSSEISLGEKTAAQNDGVVFKGEFVSGRVARDTFNGESDPIIHLFNGSNVPPNRNNTFNASKDSVNPGTGALPSEIATNPITLFTRAIYRHNDDTTWTEDANFGTSALGSRVFPEPSNARLDDSYRADDRWGPNPVYNTDSGEVIMPTATTNIGDEINPGGSDAAILNATGADGYWERRAIESGLRLIVGQRFDFGNAFGWRGNSDPLYPPTDYGTHFRAPGGTNTFDPGYNEVLQNRTLRDNLAAVQGMVVYHYEGGGTATDGTAPLACYALTAHPGTRYTVGNSRTFDNYDIEPASGQRLKVDFLSGVGTNGWEFTFPATRGTALDTALENLANMAGDPLGGAPSFPAADQTLGEIHPDPYLSTWGDFSMLKRVLAAGNGSPADESTLDSAACTLGLLAYNIDTLNDLTNDVLDGSATTIPYSLADLADAITGVVDATVGSGFEPADLANRTLEQWFNRTGGAASSEPPGPLASLIYGADLSDPSDDNADAKELFVMLSQRFQVERDRRHGFTTGVGLPDVTPDLDGSTYDPATMTYTLGTALPSPSNYGSSVPAGTTYTVACDPDTFTSALSQERRLSLAIALCPPVSNTAPYADVAQAVVRYPALYYVFPLATHDLSTGQPATELYIAESPASAATNATSYTAITDVDINTIAGQFQPQDISLWTLPDGIPRGTGDLLLSEITNNNSGNYVGAYDPQDVSPERNASAYKNGFNTGIPGTTGVYNNYDPEAEDITIAHEGQVYDVSFVDKGMYDGRENMGVRVLDIDLNLLTTETNPSGSDFWLTATGDGTQGIVYAFREDAVREDTIVRPTSTPWSSCNTITTIDDAACRMSAVIDANIQDPPVNPDTGISAKPVDFYPDPMRRPYGFRLKNGEDLSSPSGATLRREVGMTFVTDNSVYIQGNLNLHSTTGDVAGRIEEFTHLLTDPPINYGELTYDSEAFYTERERSELNNLSFAVLAEDHWRPTEILADGITIVSADFKDGSIDDGFRMESLEGTAVAERGAGQSSYMNQNRPFQVDGSQLNDRWSRENPLDDRAYISHGNAPDASTNLHLPIVSPVFVPASGNYWDSYSGSNRNRLGYYRTINGHTSDVKSMRYSNLMTPSTTYVNAILISGIVPSRSRQSYGGLHNFPRLLEDWGGGSNANRQDLYIAGAFWQFNFSTAATGPYDHDAWEVDLTPVGNELNIQYTAPERLWGYDVGLLYVPPAPISARFVTVGAARSEYYRELPVDDEYMMLLRCTEYTPGNRVDPTADNGNACTTRGL